MKIITFPGIRVEEITASPVATVLAEAVEEDLESGFVCGYSKDGSFYFNSSLADGAEVSWLCQMIITKLVRITEGGSPSLDVD